MTSISLDMLKQSVSDAERAYVDHTDRIRGDKSAARLRADVSAIDVVLRQSLTLKTADIDEVRDWVFTESQRVAPSLLAEMPVVFTKLLCGEVDVPLFLTLIDVLEEIEDGKITQKEGDARAGKLLFRVFIDKKSAAAAREEQEREERGEEAAADGGAKKLSYSEFKAEQIRSGEHRQDCRARLREKIKAKSHCSGKKNA